MQWTLNGQQTTVQFDASISEQHTGTAQVSQHQVETGPNITDHIRPMPMTLSLQAFVTNTPINSGILSPTASPAGQITNGVLQFSSSFNRVNDVYNALLDAQAGGALIAVTTSLSLYIDFAITSIGAPRDAEHGNAVQFSIELMQILTVSVTDVSAPAPLAQKKSVSQKPTTPATDTQTSQTKADSGLKKFVNFASGS